MADNHGESRSPAYVPYKTFRSYVERLRQDGIPSQLDSSVMKNLSGAAQIQLRSSMRVLNLIDHANVPTPLLERLVGADESERRDVLKEIVTKSYDFLFGSDLDLAKATAAQFKAKFNERGLSGDTARKAETFFLAIAEEAGIAVSQFIKAHRQSPQPNGKRATSRRRQDSSGKGAGPNTSSGATVDPNLSGKPQFSGKSDLKSNALASLIEKFPKFDPQWGAEATNNWLTTFREVMSVLDLIVEGKSEGEAE